MKQLIIATQNKGKANDFKVIFEPMGFEVLTLLDVAADLDIEETGSTFQENAVLKAEAVAAALQTTVIADDSGLEIDALNGEPGVYSARYAGTAKSDEANMDKVLSNMADVPVEERSARFRCVLAVASPDQPTQTFEGSCEGSILTERRGEHGFGYDPIFYVPSFDRSMAELLPQEKALISHRGNAIRELKASLPGWMKATN